MTIEEALVSSLDYERKVRDHYFHAAGQTPDPKGTEIFKALGEEEQGHVDYLESRLDKWLAKGIIDATKISSQLPTRTWLAQGKGKMRKITLQRDYSNEIQMLKDSLKLEQQVSDHYRMLVEALDGEAQKMFARFLEIEDAHTAIVQAEIDALQGDGFWFDFQEFDLEQG